MNKRDLKRIPLVLKYIREIWEEYPDLRLMQLLINVMKFQPKIDPYYVEDGDLVWRLEKLYHGRKPNMEVKKKTARKKKDLNLVATATEAEMIFFKDVAKIRQSINVQLKLVQLQEKELWDSLREKYNIPSEKFRHLTINFDNGEIRKAF